MGISGLLPQLAPAPRTSLAALSADHYTTHTRCLRLAIDISIWLFQIQSGRGGSNPALRTFYYRLLHLLSLNIHPLFVFDGPNKPLFKRNKKVGGGGGKVASVPEFLAKQLLKQFGFPWHVAPGEAEAECALLQQAGVVDAVLSEDVDTLMFGSGFTIRNWTSENSSKSPTHVDVYHAEETKKRSGLDKEGMVLVALMSGGDYLPEGIVGCGIKVACDAARAGFGAQLCALGRKDKAGLGEWRERLEREIRTNESKFFSRRNPAFTMPEDFPSAEVLGYYTHPCVSTPAKVQQLRETLQWDQAIDFSALRAFTADAFDWRCVGGAKKFIKNLAPGMLVRQLRLRAESEDQQRDPEAQERREKELVSAIRGKRNHATVDNSLEYRVLYTPASLVPIDLSLEPEDDEFIPAGGVDEDSEPESEFAALPSSTPADEEEAAPVSPSKKKRTFKPFDPSQPEKAWVLKTFLQLGCPLLVEEWEAPVADAKALFAKRRKERGVAAQGSGGIVPAKVGGKKVAKGTKKKETVQENTLTQYTTVTKPKSKAVEERKGLKELSPGANARSHNSSQEEQQHQHRDPAVVDLDLVSAFKLPSTQVPASLLSKYVEPSNLTASSQPLRPKERTTTEIEDRPFARFASHNPKQADVQRTPPRRKKRAPADTPDTDRTQRSIMAYYSPSPRKPREESEVINLISSPDRPGTPTPAHVRHDLMRDGSNGRVVGQRRSSADRVDLFSPGKLPDTVTKRRRKGPLKRCRTVGVDGADHDVEIEVLLTPRSNFPDLVDKLDVVETMDLAFSPAAIRQQQRRASEESLPSPSLLVSTALPTIKPLPQPAPKPLQPAVDPPPLAALHPKQPHPHPPPPSFKQPPRRSPRQAEAKKRIQLRESLEGAWKEVLVVEALDLTGDGSGWRASRGRAKVEGQPGWRRSGVEMVDLTGA